MHALIVLPKYARVALGLCVLSACSSTQQQPSLSSLPAGPSEYKLAESRCEGMLTGNKFTRKTAVPYHRCLYELHNQFQANRSDLDRALDAKKIELAEQYAAGKLTASQFEARSTEFEVQIENTRLTRSTQQSNAESARISATALQSPPIQPVMVMPLPGTVSNYRPACPPGPYGIACRGY